MSPSSSSTGLRGLIATGILVALTLSPSIVCAADPSSTSRTVKFSDLNLSEPSDAQVLYMRLLAAAHVVCSYIPFATDGDKARCVRDAIADAVTRIDRPELSAVYERKSKTPMPSSLVSQSR